MRLTHMLWVSLAGIEVTMENPIISINHAHKTFTQGGKSKYTHTALEDVSLSVETGDITVSYTHLRAHETKANLHYRQKWHPEDLSQRLW